MGSGGLPGVVFAICCPTCRDVGCVDTVAKKAAFIQQAGSAAANCQTCNGRHARVETWMACSTL